MEGLVCTALPPLIMGYMGKHTSLSNGDGRIADGKSYSSLALVSFADKEACCVNIAR